MAEFSWSVPRASRSRMAVAPTPIETCRLLDEDPDLAEALPNGRRERATEELSAPCIHVPAGRWVPPELDPTGIGMVVISGVLLRHLAIDGRVGIELIGETDVIRPWQGSDAPTLSLSEEWSVLMPARLAWLDERCGSVIARYPELTNRLLDRAVRRSRHPRHQPRDRPSAARRHPPVAACSGTSPDAGARSAATASTCRSNLRTRCSLTSSQLAAPP